MTNKMTGPVRLSFLAVVAFVGGLLTAATALAAWIVLWVANHPASLNIPLEGVRFLFVGARITAFCALAPALFTAVFWLLARGAFRESEGALRGRSLYRSGFILAVLGACISVAGRPSIQSRAEAGEKRARAEDANRPSPSPQERAQLRQRYLSMVEDRLRGDGRSFANHFRGSGSGIEDRIEFASMVSPLEGMKTSDLLDLKNLRVFTIKEAQEQFKTGGPLTKELWSGLREDDVLVIAPVRDVPSGFSRESVVASFLVGVTGEVNYIYYVYRKEWWHWTAVPMGPRMRVEDLGGRNPRMVCPKGNCALKRYDTACPTHKVAIREQRWACERCWVLSAEERDCPKCRKALVPVYK